MAHFADCWSHLARRTSHTVVPPLGAQKSRERCERSRCVWMACMKVNRGRLVVFKGSSVLLFQIWICMCVFLLVLFSKTCISICSVFCSCSSIFVCSRASVPLSLFCLSVQVSCSKIGILIYIFVFWIRSVVFKFLFYSTSGSVPLFWSIQIFVFCLRFQVRV